MEFSCENLPRLTFSSGGHQMFKFSAASHPRTKLDTEKKVDYCQEVSKPGVYSIQLRGVGILAKGNGNFQKTVEESPLLIIQSYQNNLLGGSQCKCAKYIHYLVTKMKISTPR